MEISRFFKTTTLSDTDIITHHARAAAEEAADQGITAELAAAGEPWAVDIELTEDELGRSLTSDELTAWERAWHDRLSWYV